MKLSIIVPIRNGEKYLESCIESILNQTYKEFELILVNNGSTDGSAEIIERFRRLDDRVVSLKTEGKRVNEVRQIGINTSHGEYIGFVDCDDTIENEMYEVLMQFALKNKLDMVSSGMIKDFISEGKSESCDDTLPEGIYDKENLRQKIYPYMLYHPPFYTHGIQPSLWNKIYKKKLLQEIFEDLDTSIIFGEDATVVYAALLKSKKVGLIKKGFYHYKVHKNSNTLTPHPEFLENSYRLHNQLKKTFENDMQKEELLYQLKFYSIHVAIFNLNSLFGINFFDLGEWYMPFASFLNNKTVMLWGAGSVGMDFYKQIKSNENIKEVIWVDADVNKQSELVKDPSFLLNNNKHIDKVVIAVCNERIKCEIEKEVQMMNFSAEDILWAKYEKKFL